MPRRSFTEESRRFIPCKSQETAGVTTPVPYSSRPRPGLSKGELPRHPVSQGSSQWPGPPSRIPNPLRARVEAVDGLRRRSPACAVCRSPAGNGASSGTGPVRTGSSCQVGRRKDVSGLRVQAGQSLSQGQEPCWVGLKQEGADSGLSRTTGPELGFARWRRSSLWEAALLETLAARVWGPVLLLNPGGPGPANTADVDVGQVASKLTFEACGDDGLPMNVKSGAIRGRRNGDRASSGRADLVRNFSERAASVRGNGSETAPGPSFPPVPNVGEQKEHRANDRARHLRACPQKTRCADLAEVGIEQLIDLVSGSPYRER